MGGEAVMDLICGGMYRSCSTWQYEVATALLRRFARGGVEPLGYLTGAEYARLSRATREPIRGWRVLKSHEESPVLARVLRRGEARALYSFRDVREVVFSMLHKRRESFETFLYAGRLHQILVNDRFWRNQPGVLIQRYDDLTARPAEGVGQIARFLGLEGVTPEACQAIAQEFSKEANLERTRQLRERLTAQGVDLDDPANALVWDRETLLHWNHVRESAPTWRDLATPAQRRILGAVCGSWLIEQGFETDDRWIVAAVPADRAPRWRLDPAERAAVRRGLRANWALRTSLRHPVLVATLKRWLKQS
jgi:hypothetical protein